MTHIIIDTKGTDSGMERIGLVAALVIAAVAVLAISITVKAQAQSSQQEQIDKLTTIP